ncbi:ribose-phosphate pyrophosphokinase [Candidatus Saccharibacteria bacterium]|nr:MAG: ribose-phosphate pyrophosphokinase [Candidatus Saccharibacteria bacterium]
MVHKITLNPDDLYIVSGTVHPRLAEDAAAAMGLTLGPLTTKRFANSEMYVQYRESVRGKHVIIIQTFANDYKRNLSVNDALMETMLLIDAAYRSSAREITVVIPYLGYSRQDRKAKGREPISAAVVTHMLQTAGAHRLVTIDMHSPQVQGTFHGPFDHLVAERLILEGLKEEMGDRDPELFAIVSPDTGRAKDSERAADLLGIRLRHLQKTRDRHDSSKLVRPKRLQGVEGRICFMTDDMIDTAGTLITAAETLKKSGATAVIASATHALLSDPAIERLQSNAIDKLIVTDTVPIDYAKKVLSDKLTVLPVAPMIAAALHEVATGGSVSDLFEGRNYF